MYKFGSQEPVTIPETSFIDMLSRGLIPNFRISGESSSGQDLPDAEDESDDDAESS